MTYVVLVCCLVIFLAGACSNPKAPTMPANLTAEQRINVAMDSLNAAVHQLYRDGGEVTYLGLLYPDPVDAPPPPPSVAIIVRKP